MSTNKVKPSNLKSVTIATPEVQNQVVESANIVESIALGAVALAAAVPSVPDQTLANNDSGMHDTKFLSSFINKVKSYKLYIMVGVVIVILGFAIFYFYNKNKQIMKKNKNKNNDKLYKLNENGDVQILDTPSNKSALEKIAADNYDADLELLKAHQQMQMQQQKEMQMQQQQQQMQMQMQMQQQQQMQHKQKETHQKVKLVHPQRKDEASSDSLESESETDTDSGSDSNNTSDMSLHENDNVDQHNLTNDDMIEINKSLEMLQRQMNKK